LQTGRNRVVVEVKNPAIPHAASAKGISYNKEWAVGGKVTISITIVEVWHAGY